MKFVAATLLLASCNGVMALQVDCFNPANKAAAYVVARDVTVRSVPDPVSDGVARAGLGERVCLLADRGGVDGRRWALISDSGPNPHRGVLGWLPRNMVALRTEFMPMRSLAAQTLLVEIGDYVGEYEVSAGGAFATSQVVSEHPCRRRERPNEYGACEDTALFRGTIKRRGALAIAMTGDGRDLDQFRVTEGGGLCPWQYGLQPPACAARPDTDR